MSSGNAEPYMRDNDKGMYRGEGWTPVTTAIQKVAKRKTECELNWKVTAVTEKTC